MTFSLGYIAGIFTLKRLLTEIHGIEIVSVRRYYFHHDKPGELLYALPKIDFKLELLCELSEFG